MKSDISFKLDRNAHLWVRAKGSDWKRASREETEQVFLAYPELAVQALWIGDHPATTKAKALAIAA